MIAEGAWWANLLGFLFWLGVILGALLLIGKFYHDPNPPYDGLH